MSFPDPELRKSAVFEGPADLYGSEADMQNKSGWTMHMPERAQATIFNAVAQEAAGPAIAHEGNYNPVLSLADRRIGTGIEVCAAALPANFRESSSAPSTMR